MRNIEEEKADERENKTIAGISTALILSLLFVLMLFLVFGNNTIDDEIEELGVEVSYGQPDAGGGSSSDASAPEQNNTTVQDQVEDPLLSQDDEDAPVVKKVDKPKDKPQKETKPKVDSDLSSILNDLGKNKNKSNGQSSNKDGNGNGNGSNDGPGEGSGTKPGKQGNGGISSFSLGNRGITKNPPSNNNFTRSGTVVLKIYVNRSGKVVRASVYRGSSNDPNLQRIAKELAYKTRFDANLNGPVEQEGKITFKFEL